MRTGQVIGKGRYRLRELIGRGGMGEVYLADGPNGTRAAVKFIRADESAEDPAMFEARFIREAKIARSLQCEQIPAVLYTGRTRSGELCIAFEYLEGESLAARLAREPALPMRVLAPIINDVLKALEVAHAAGVVHRDIKPGNIFLETGGERARVLDFGVAKRIASANGSSASSALTSVDATLGSMTYMAPEQIRGAANVDARADLYALGVVAFQSLTGRLPFVSAFPVAVSKARLDAMTLRQVTNVEWPQDTETWLSRLLAREPSARYADARSTREAWEQCRMASHPLVSEGRDTTAPDRSTETRR